MNTMVAARVPIEIKEQGDSILKSLGSNPTDLINKAYAYVLKNGCLPGEDDALGKKANIRRSVSLGMIQNMRSVYEGMSLPLADAWGEKTFKEIRDELEDDRYARLA